MNYSEAIQFLHELQLFGLKFGLENTLRLAALAGNPQDKLRFIHVAGTNGKGSVCAMLENIYRAAGLRVGLFTSPHLVSFAERIQVNRRWISHDDVARLADQIKNCEGSPTFFEAVTVLALKYFEEQRCDLVIWETGMGGRLDATNIVTPLASVITNVQLDHQQWLGQTLPEIAREKAGIIKAGIPLITSAEEPDALRVILDTAEKLHAPASVVNTSDAQAMAEYEIALPGAHQRMNAAVAARVARTLNGLIPVSDAALRLGLKETEWPGRQQIVRRDNGQTILLDGAHNPAGARTLAGAFDGKPFALILGMMRDKDAGAVCELLAPGAAQIFLTPLGSERSADPQLLAEPCRRANSAASIVVCKNLADAFALASEPFVMVGGSLYLIGEALEYLGLTPASPERTLNEYGAAPIRAVTFDAGGTLFEPWPSVGEIYAKVAKQHGIRVAAAVLNQRFAAAWNDKKNFGYTKADWSALVDQTFAGLAEAPPDAPFFSELYEEFVNASAWRVFDDVRPCLEQLKRNGLRLGLVSNWDDRLRPLLKALKLDDYFDTVIVSCEAGHQKPAPEIFRAAASQLNIPPHQILHIGDSRREDVAGARAAGFQSLLLARGTAASQEGSIISLAELPDGVACKPR